MLDDEARQKRATSPLRVFDVKSERVQEALADAPKIGDSLCDECRAHFDAVQAHLENYGVEFTLAPTLVRGLDYYTRTTFEFVDEAIGAQSSICGGGRYDGLIEEIGGQPTPGHRLRRRDRAAAALARGGGREPRARGDRRLRRAARGGRPQAARAAARAGAAAPRPARRRRLRGPLAQGPAHAGAAGSAPGRSSSGAPSARRVRRPGQQDEEVPTAELAERLRR